MDTIFEKILQKEIPANIVHENDAILAFHDISPQAPVHVLVIPKQKFHAFHEASVQDPLLLSAFFLGIAETIQVLGLEKDGYRVVFNTGIHGQQSVDYIHAHILGGRQLSWPPG